MRGLVLERSECVASEIQRLVTSLAKYTLKFYKSKKKQNRINITRNKQNETLLAKMTLHHL